MRFENPDPRHRPPGRLDVLRWAFLDPLRGRRRRAPLGPPATAVTPDVDRIHDPEGPPRITWLGHASILATIAGESLLVDPVFSDRIGWFYPRYAAVPLRPDQLPPVRLILITHNHYDHLDGPSIDALDRSATVIVPAKLASWFCTKGFAQIVELRWWERVTIGDITINAVPARHWSRRTPFDTNRSHWNGYVIERAGVTIYHAGDTAWFDGFAEIGTRFPRLDIACIPAGAYEPRWFMQHNHVSPEEAAEAFLLTRARMFMPIHWGAFQLADEPLTEPATRIAAWWSRHNPPGRTLWIPAIGETQDLTAHTTRKS